MKLFLGIVCVICVGVAIFLLWPSPIESRVFDSGPMPELVGPLAPNRKLEACRRISDGEMLRYVYDLVQSIAETAAAEKPGAGRRAPGKPANQARRTTRKTPKRPAGRR